jgi:hypothetical protein
MPTFEIPDGPTTIDASRSAEGSAVYSVTNTTSDTVDGRLGVRVSGASRDEWFTVDGNRERTFAPGETQTATIRVRFPGDAPAGDYPFRLRAVMVNDPDNDYAEGPMTTARLGPGGGTKSLLWLWILLGLLAVAGIGGVAYYVLSPTDEVETRPLPPSPPPPAPPPAPAALDTVQAMRLAEKKTGAWFAALAEKNIDTLVELSDPPFYFHDGLLFSKPQIKNKYTVILLPHSDTLRVRQLSSTTLGDLKSKSERFNSEIPNSLGLKDDDIVVTATMEPDGLLFFFRRSSTDVQMAGIWG